METVFTLPPLNPILPEILLLCIGLVLIGIDLFFPRNRELLTRITLLAGVGLIAALLYQEPASSFGTMFVVDSYALFFKVVCLTGLVLATLMSDRYLDMEGIHQGEYYSLMVFSVVGMMFMASAGDLIVVYLGLELMALSIYCLVGLQKHEHRSNEAALKYFLMGSFSSAILLFGISIVYGMTGTTDIRGIGQAITDMSLINNPALMTGFVMILAGFCFKVAAAPFHFWAPDIYEGAPTSVTAFMSVAPKAASFAVLGRILFVAFPEIHHHWDIVVAVIALLTMAVGNIMALSQTSIKRMLAYSSIGHAGYALLGVLPGTAEGLSATMNYLLIYALMNMGAFAILILMCDKNNRRESLEAYKGLAGTNPMAAALMLIFFFSLAGIPPTAGFVGKFYLLKAALAAGYTCTVVGAVLLSAVSAWFYLKVVRYMYMSEPGESFTISYTPSLLVVVWIAVIGVVGLGIMPGTLLDWAASSLIGS
ncbi:MAG: NADH-quinone oxidoreductase subunit N [Thermodesulfobacteriota bacterium]